MRTLETEEIGKAYAGRQVVRGVNMQIGQGEVVGLLGPNGAGKTTCFYIIVGLVRPDAGRIVAGWRRHHAAADVPAGAGVWHQLSAAGAFDLSQAHGGGEHPGGAGGAAVEPGEAAHADGEADRAVEPGPCAQDHGLCAERGRAAEGGDCALPGDRAGVHPARRAVLRHRSDRGAGAAGDHLRR